jgi:hypothetical protein
MKRAIKFRAKHRRTGGWEFFTLKEVRKIHDLIDWKTLGQSLGLEDQQGKGMYDGDILQFQNGKLSDPITFPHDYHWLKTLMEDVPSAAVKGYVRDTCKNRSHAHG